MYVSFKVRDLRGHLVMEFRGKPPFEYYRCHMPLFSTKVPVMEMDMMITYFRSRGFIVTSGTVDDSIWNKIVHFFVKGDKPCCHGF